MEKLDNNDLIKLIESVFPRLTGDKELAVVIDLPENEKKDNSAWGERRVIASDWVEALKSSVNHLGLERVKLVAYPGVGSSNADLPSEVFIIEKDLPNYADQLKKTGTPIKLTELFETTQIFIALTEYSATAPFKMAAKRYGFRAATMPGFNSSMIPALKIDFEQVNNRLALLKEKLDYASTLSVQFVIDGIKVTKMVFDLFQSVAHVSSGRFLTKGSVGNLPSGETYIVPYEGGKGVASKTKGHLPVQYGDELVLFRVRQNNISKVLSDTKKSKEMEKYLATEPAYGNIAEVGFGILGELGFKPINQILFDEKLGFHIAFGRSDHFGGIIGPAQFSSPKAVVHDDRVYLPEITPRIKIHSIVLQSPGSKNEVLFKDGKYYIW